MADLAAPAGADDALAAKVAFLCRPDSFPEPTVAVESIETHLSWLFLIDQYAYKLKKPYQRGPINYASVAARRLNCRRELRLNRRLAKDVYLAVVPLTCDSDVRLAIDGRGRTVDWLVRMRRLPASLALDWRLQAGRVDPHDAERIVACLVPFFAAATPVKLSPLGYRRRWLRTIRQTAEMLLRQEFGLPLPLVAEVAQSLRRFVIEQADLLTARVLAGRIVEGHGDLRPEHIYLTEPPSIVDCIEFDRRLRQSDPANELAFLAMETDRLSSPQFGQWLFDAYCRLAADAPSPRLIAFYQAGNAFVRARLAVLHLQDADTGPPTRWVRSAKAYLQSSRAYLQTALCADHADSSIA